METLSNDCVSVFGVDSETITKRVLVANFVYDLIDKWLNDAGVKDALEHEKNKFSGNDVQFTLEVPATIAAYFLFYMVTIYEQESNHHLMGSFTLNVKLLKAMIENKDRLALNPTLQLKAMLEAGFSMHFGLVWSESTVI